MSTQLLYIRDTWDVYTISKSMVRLRYHNMSLLVGVGYLVYYWQYSDMQPYFCHCIFSQYSLQNPSTTSEGK